MLLHRAGRTQHAELSSRYALLIGPALTSLGGATGSLDAGFGVGGVLGWPRAWLDQPFWVMLPVATRL